MTKVAVIYYSATGNVHALAQAIAEGSDVLAAARYQGRRLAAIAALIASGQRGERLAA
jgi:NAD(P)H dehydrogenase (quinone)